jgi:hypothetical protein
MYNKLLAEGFRRTDQSVALLLLDRLVLGTATVYTRGGWLQYCNFVLYMTEYLSLTMLFGGNINSLLLMRV